MIILVINCGSSSLKYELFDLNREQSLFAGSFTNIGGAGGKHRYRGSSRNQSEPMKIENHLQAVDKVLKVITEMEEGPVLRISDLGAVAHRIGHGGLQYRSPVIIDDRVEKEIERLIPLMPLHHPAMLDGIRSCRRLLPEIPQVAVFDTAFHSTIPEEATVYGLPYKYHQRGIRKFGFHGNSHHFVALKASEYLETPLRRLKIISCHLGNGASVCAIRHGYSIDTSMGFSPLPGLLMGTRSGDIDPGILTYLMRNDGLSPDEVDEMLNRESGLKGISGVSNDMREILAAAEEGNHRALLAIKVFCYRVKHYIGAYTALLGGTDVLIFTAGIGENSAGERMRCVQGLEKIGFGIDYSLNKNCAVSHDNPVCDISSSYSRASILVISTDEELMIARQCAQALDYQKSIKHHIYAKNKRPIRVAVSARHVHLSNSDLAALFGRDASLTERERLYMESNFAAHETVNLHGPKGLLENVRIIGPVRPQTQVEISRTDEFKLGIDAPIRESGDLEGSPGITIEGPAGAITINEGVICAMRHIHMSPEDARYYGVADQDIVMVKLKGERELIFGDVLIRVDKGVRTEMHLDTDEANAAELPPVSEGFLVRIESRE